MAGPHGRTSSARVFVLSSGSDIHPRFSPDGKSLAFLSDRENPLAKDKGLFFDCGRGGTQDLFKRDKEPGEKDAAKRDSQIWIISLDGGEATPLRIYPAASRRLSGQRMGNRWALFEKIRIRRKKRNAKSARMIGSRSTRITSSTACGCMSWRPSKRG